MVKIKFYEVFKEEKIFLQKMLPKSWHVSMTSATIQESGDKKVPASMICIRTQSIIPPLWSNQLCAVLTRSQGFDHLQKFRETTNTKVVCGYLSEYSARAVAEHALTVTLMMLKKIEHQKNRTRNFNRDDLTGFEINQRRVLVVGVGQIGSKIVKLFSALGADVKGVDIVHRLKTVKYVSLLAGLTWADIVVCAVPLTHLTENLLSAAQLSKCKNGSFLINISRGEVTPLEDLDKLLRNGKLAGVALDVYPKEAILAEDLRLHKNKHPNNALIKKWLNDERVILTPHNAFNTMEATERKSRLTVDAWQNFLKKGTFPRKVV